MTANDFQCKLCKDRSCAVAILSDPELETLSKNIVKVHFEKGESLFKQDTLNAHIIYIREGLVKVHMQMDNKKDFILKIVPAPAYLGLSTIFGDSINQYSATAIESTQACIIDESTFKAMICHNGKFAYEIIADICKEELCYFRQHVNHVHKQVPGRLAGTLIYFSEKVYKSDQFKLSLNRSELAEMIGTSRESVTRNLYQFKEAGIIDINRNEIRILKPKSLQVIYEAG